MPCTHQHPVTKCAQVAYLKCAQRGGRARSACEPILVARLRLFLLCAHCVFDAEYGIRIFSCVTAEVACDAKL